MKFEKLSSNRVKFTFTVTPHEFEHALEHAFHHIKDDIEIKGFRKGHVTRAIYEKKFGANALYPDALNHAIGHKFDDALAVKEFTIVSDPSNIDFNWDLVGKGDFDISFEVAIKPEVTLGDYKGIEVAKVDTTVSTEEVKAEIDSLLKRGASLEPKAEGALETGDTAIFDFEGFLDGVPFEG